MAQVNELRTKLERYQQFLQQDPKNVRIITQIVDFYQQLGEFEQARSLIDDTLKSGVTHTGLLYRLSNIALASGDPEEAEKQLSSLRAQGINNSAIEYNLAYSYLLQHRIEEAIEILFPLVENNDSDAPDAKLLLARCFHYQGKFDDAIALGEQYIETHPDHQEALGVLALLCSDANQRNKARQYAEHTVSLNPKNLEARVTLGAAALDEQDPEHALTHFRSALEAHPKSGRAWSGLGMADILNLDIDQAIASLKNAVNYMSNHIGTWHALAWCYLIKGDLLKAKDCLDTAILLDRNFGETHGGLAVVAVLQGQYEKATILARKAVLLDANSFSGRFAQSMLKNKTDPEAAQLMVQQIMQSKIGSENKTLSEMISSYLKRNTTNNNLH